MSGFSNWITTVAELMGGIEVTNPSSATPTADDDFNAIYPSAILDAEGMMYRDPDLDFLQTRGTDATANTSAGTRTLAIPSQVLIVEQAALITPAATPPASGTRVNLSRVSMEWINDVYPVQSYTAAPVYGQSYYAIFDGSNIIIAPTPNASYTCEFYGVLRQTTLSASNPDTVLTTYFPDIFNAASLIYLSAYMKNFSAAGADNPPQAISWQSHYDSLKKGAAFQSARTKYLARGPYPPLSVQGQ